MITGVIKNKIDKIWTDIFAGGISNPITVIEQLTYLMFIHDLDVKELETERLENLTHEKMDRIFPQTPAGQALRWHNFKDKNAAEIFATLKDRVFPFIKNELGKDGQSANWRTSFLNSNCRF